MKSEHRHDLETNWLAHHMAVWIGQLKPHTTKLLLAGGVVIGLLLVVSISSSVSASKDKAAWEAYALAVNSTDPELMHLQQVAEEYPGTTMQEWAYATWADRQLMIASSRYLIDRESSLERLRNVQGIYDSITLAGDQQVRDRAHFGLARIYEMLDQLDKAKTEYALVQGDLAPLAQERAGQLESSEVQQACQWLHTAKLPTGTSPTGTSSTRSGLFGERPPFEAASPTIGNDPLLQKSIEELLGGPMSSVKEEPLKQTETPEQTAPEQTAPEQSGNLTETENQKSPQDGEKTTENGADEPAQKSEPAQTNEP